MILLWLAILLTIGISLGLLGAIIYTLKRFGKAQSQKLSNFLNWIKQHRVVKILGLVIVILGCLLGALNISTRIAYSVKIQPINGKGEWRDSNKQAYYYVEATDRYSLGYLEGQGLAHQIVNFQGVIKYLGLTSDISDEEMITQALNYLEYIPEEYREEMRGMADGASQGSGQMISFNEILLQNCFLDLMYGHWIPDGLLKWVLYGGCTDVGVKNPDGSIVLGQNLDYPDIMDIDSILPSMSFVHVNYSGVPESFGARMGGMICLPTIKTALNFTVVVAVIQSNVRSNYSMPAVIAARIAFERAQTVEELIDMVFVKQPITVSFAVLASDGKTFGGVQCTPNGYRISYNQSLVNTNRFVYDDWNDQYYTDGNYSLTRQQYAERLLREKQTDGAFSYEDLISVLSTTEDGVEGEHSAPCYDEGITGDATLATFTGKHFSLGREYTQMGNVPI